MSECVRIACLDCFWYLRSRVVLFVSDYVMVGVMDPALLDAESLMKGLGQKPSGKNGLAVTVCAQFQGYAVCI